MIARLVAETAGPLTSIQDSGRLGAMRFGVARSGPVDRLAFAAAQAATGSKGAAIEVSLGGLVLRCVEGEVGFALTGGDFAATLGGVALGSWATATLRPGDRLAIREGVGGNWGVLAFAGTLVTRTWLGSAATHAPAGLGGGRVVAGQALVVEDARAVEARALPRPPEPATVFRIVAGPQERYFPPAALAALTRETFAPTAAFDRMGMVLSGPPLVPLALDMLSEPIVRGAVQVNGAGVATVLLADHQTTGGYPKIATVISADLDRLAQLRSGTPFRFAAVSAEQGVSAARAAHEAATDWLRHLANPVSFADRLHAANLIDGVIDATAG